CQRAAVYAPQAARRALSGLARHQNLPRSEQMGAGADQPAGTERAFRVGIVLEALNPKTAAFFLAFIPQFLDQAADFPALQFIALGLISVALNTSADVIVVMV